MITHSVVHGDDGRVLGYRILNGETLLAVVIKNSAGQFCVEKTMGPAENYVGSKVFPRMKDLKIAFGRYPSSEKGAPRAAVQKNDINMYTTFEDRFPNLFRKKWNATGLADNIAKVDRESLCHEYMELIRAAPRRPDIGKKYFVGHSGVPSSGTNSNRREEHYAIALCNLGQEWPRLGGGWFRLLDYQVPLKAQQSDSGIGKIDLVGVTDQGRLIVIELKVEASGNGRGDAPSTALMEGLRYSAIVQANLDAIAKEADARFGVKITQEPPIVLLLAPLKWWRGWLGLSGRTRSVVGGWETEFAQLIQDVKLKIGITVECMALEDVDLALGQNGQAPKFARVPALDPKDVILHFVPSHQTTKLARVSISDFVQLLSIVLVLLLLFSFFLL